jgi:hypothetical protein
MLNCENLFEKTATIPAGAAVTEIVPTNGMSLVAIICPPAWTSAVLRANAGIGPAAVTPVVSRDGVAQDITVTPSAYVPFPLSDAVYGPYLQLHSCDTSGVDVNQAVAATFTLLFRKLFS